MGKLSTWLVLASMLIIIQSSAQQGLARLPFEDEQITNLDLSKIAFGNGKFVAVGRQGVMLASADGARWEVQMSPDRTDLWWVTYGNGQFIAFDTNFTAHVSTDGSSWISKPTAGLQRIQPTSVAWGNGLFVAVGDHGCAASSNALDWTVSKLPAANVSRVAYGNGTFVALGGNCSIFASTNGLDWTVATSRILFNPPIDVAFGNAQFVVSDGSQFAVSTDGLTWQSLGNGSSLELEHLSFGNGVFIAAAFRFGGTATSPDGRFWTQHSGIVPFFNAWPRIRDFASGNGEFVAVDSWNSLLVSADGLDWETVGPYWMRPTLGPMISPIVFGLR